MDLSMLMQQAQAMSQKVKEQQQELKKLKFEGSAGGDMVKAVVNGEAALIGLDIDKSVIDPEDPEMLADLIIAAVNDAQKKIGDKKSDALKEMTGGMDLSSLGIRITSYNVCYTKLLRDTFIKD